MRAQPSIFVAVFLAVGAASLICSASLADEAATRDASADSSAAGNSLEEITVYGRKSSAEMAILFKQAQFDFLDVYNNLNTVDEFRVVCEKRATTGSKFKKDHCEPVYYTKAAGDAFQDAVGTKQIRRDGAGGFAGLGPSGQAISNATRAKQKEAIQHMISLVESNPALRKKYDELVQTQLAYERSKASR